MLVTAFMFSETPINGMGIMWGIVTPYLVKIFGLRGKKPFTAYFVPFLFIFMFLFLVAGFMPGVTAIFTNIRFVFSFRFRAWLVAFIYNICTKPFHKLFWHRNYGLALALFLFPIEVIREFMKPNSLTIRL